MKNSKTVGALRLSRDIDILPKFYPMTWYILEKQTAMFRSEILRKEWSTSE